MSKNLESALELLIERSPLHISCVLSPQHGWYGVEQANMIPSADGSLFGRPLFSLYTDKTRKLTKEQLSHFDCLIVDLQDVGCRVYTYLSCVLYALKSCFEEGYPVFILDRPNPAGRPVEGFFIKPGFESVVGAWRLPIRYGMTLAETARAYVSLENLKGELNICAMEGYEAKRGWPADRTWINPSPNMTGPECAQCYSGTVLLEGTKISEGRGTTSPLQVFGFPEMKTDKILKKMSSLKEEWMRGCRLRPCFFKPTFDKFKDEVCSGVHIHVQSPEFRPFRLMSLFLKALHQVHEGEDWLLPPPYEYEYEKKPLDILSGSSFLREWLLDKNSQISNLEKKLAADEEEWKKTSPPFCLY